MHKAWAQIIVMSALVAVASKVQALGPTTIEFSTNIDIGASAKFLDAKVEAQVAAHSFCRALNLGYLDHEYKNVHPAGRFVRHMIVTKVKCRGSQRHIQDAQIKMIPKVVSDALLSREAMDDEPYAVTPGNPTDGDDPIVGSHPVFSGK